MSNEILHTLVYYPIVIVIVILMLILLLILILICNCRPATSILEIRPAPDPRQDGF